MSFLFVTKNRQEASNCDAQENDLMLTFNPQPQLNHTRRGVWAFELKLCIHFAATRRAKGSLTRCNECTEGYIEMMLGDVGNLCFYPRLNNDLLT